MKLVRKPTKPASSPDIKEDVPSPSASKHVVSHLNSDDVVQDTPSELDVKLEQFARSSKIDDDTLSPSSPATIDEIPVGVEGPAPLKDGEIPTDEQIEQQVNSIVSQKLDDNSKFKRLREYGQNAFKTAREERSARLKLEQDLEETKKKILPEEEVTRLRNAEQLIKLREVESLPEWGEYDKAVEKISGEARSLLLGFARNDTDKTELEKTLKVIDERGGLIKFSESDARADGGKNDKDGKPLIRNTDGSPMSERDYFTHRIYAQLDQRQRTQFDILTTEAKRKQAEKNTQLEQAKANADGTLKQRGEQARKVFTEEATTTLKKLHQDELPKLGYPTEKPVLMAADTPEEKKQKEEWILQWDRVEKELNSPLPTPTAITTARFHAAMYPVLMEQMIALKKSLEDEKKLRLEAEQRWDGIKDARRLRRTTPVDSNHKPAGKMQSTDEVLTARFGPNALNN